MSPKSTTPKAFNARSKLPRDGNTSKMTNRSEVEVPKRRTWAAHTNLTARTKKATVDLNDEEEDVRAEEVKECEGDETPSAAVARY